MLNIRSTQGQAIKRGIAIGQSHKQTRIIKENGQADDTARIAVLIRKHVKHQQARLAARSAMPFRGGLKVRVKSSHGQVEGQLCHLFG